MTLTADELAAQAAGYALPEGTSSITNGDDAIRQNAVRSHQDGITHKHDEYQFRGTLPGTDLNTLTGRESNGVWALSSGETYINSPSPTGMLVVEGTAFAARQYVVTVTGAPAVERTLRNYSQQAWTLWEPSTPTASTVASGEALDAMRSTAPRIVQSQTIAQSIPDWPVDLVSPQPAVIDVRATSAGLISQTLRPLYSENVLLGRVTNAISPSPYPFGPWRDLSASTASSDPGLTNALLVQDFTRRLGGTPTTGGKAAFAFRCDHGLANIDGSVLPLLRARGIVPSIALNSRNWEYPENTGVTAATVDAWVAAGEVEIWNHGATHGDATTTAALEDEIVTGLAELRAQLPSAQIDGWVVPGVGSDPTYGGFNNGRDVASFYGTEAGRLILEHHAVSTGYVPGTHQVILDGTVRQGGHQFTIDAQTLTAFEAEVDAAIAAGTGLQAMLHPSQLDQTDRITTATLTAMLDYVVAKRDAGQLVTLSPYQMVAADARL